MNYEWDIIQVLKSITKIDQHHWTQTAQPESKNMEGEDYWEFTYELANNWDTKARMLSFHKMLVFDGGEQFKTLFNTLMTIPHIYVIAASGLDTIADQANVLDLTTRTGWNMSDVLGMGMLHATNETTHTIQSFCTENWGWSETQVACRTVFVFLFSSLIWIRMAVNRC